MTKRRLDDLHKALWRRIEFWLSRAATRKAPSIRRSRSTQLRCDIFASAPIEIRAPTHVLLAGPELFPAPSVAFTCKTEAEPEGPGPCFVSPRSDPYWTLNVELFRYLRREARSRASPPVASACRIRS